MRVGITGHQSLKDPQAWDWVRATMRELLATMDRPLNGITCLAMGADSVFAEVVLEHNGSIEAVLPFPECDLKLQAHDREAHRRLLDRASRVTVLEKKSSDEEAYLEAGKRVVDDAELIFAVWDGKPARGLGGTADIVRYALEKGKEIIHLNSIEHSVTRSRSKASFTQT
jgi:hypothetical protein